jgi:predicted XRE-type DNA-binding protein
VTANQLLKAHATYNAAIDTTKTAKARRTEVVREALATGWTQQQIADTLGITRSRISQIATGRA